MFHLLLLSVLLHVPVSLFSGLLNVPGGYLVGALSPVNHIPGGDLLSVPVIVSGGAVLCSVKCSK